MLPYAMVDFYLFYDVADDEHFWLEVSVESLILNCPTFNCYTLYTDLTYSYGKNVMFFIWLKGNVL